MTEVACFVHMDGGGTTASPELNSTPQPAQIPKAQQQITSSLWGKVKKIFRSDPCGNNPNCVTVYAEPDPVPLSFWGRLGNAWMKATSPIDKAARWADNHPLLLLPLAGLAAMGGNEGPIEADELTAEEYISQYLKGGINSVFPGQFRDSTIKVIEAAAKNGDRAAKTALKLLTDGRFKK
jgi:hypothetical protein